MGIDVLIDIHPERIKTIKELDDILLKINKYEKEMKCKAGVVLKQNRQLGGSYRIVSEEEAKEGINNSGKCEWYVKFYSKAYFEELRSKLPKD